MIFRAFDATLAFTLNILFLFNQLRQTDKNCVNFILSMPLAKPTTTSNPIQAYLSRRKEKENINLQCKQFCLQLSITSYTKNEIFFYIFANIKRNIQERSSEIFTLVFLPISKHRISYTSFVNSTGIERHQYKNWYL